MTHDQLTTALRAHAVTPGGRTVVTTTHRRLIRQARAAGMRIREVAEALGVAVTTVSKYSSDEAQMRLDEYQRRRALSPEQRERRRKQAYARWLKVKSLRNEAPAILAPYR